MYKGFFGLTYPVFVLLERNELPVHTVLGVDWVVTRAIWIVESSRATLCYGSILYHGFLSTLYLLDLFLAVLMSFHQSNHRVASLQNEFWPRNPQGHPLLRFIRIERGSYSLEGPAFV